MLDLILRGVVIVHAALELGDALAHRACDGGRLSPRKNGSPEMSPQLNLGAARAYI
jgi:hypothetical protein